MYVAKVGSGFSINPQMPALLSAGSSWATMRSKLANKIKPEDIMTVHTSDPKDAKVFYNGKANWIKSQPGMEKAAAFLETQRYAYLMGASMGFTKMEGTTVNVKDKIAYSALHIQDSMVKVARAGTKLVASHWTSL